MHSMLPEHRGAPSGKGKLLSRGEAVGVGVGEQGRRQEGWMSEGEAVPNKRSWMSKGTKTRNTIIWTTSPFECWIRKSALMSDGR